MIRLYKVPNWYHEVVEMVRRVTMTSTLTLLYPVPDLGSPSLPLAVVASLVAGTFFLHNLIRRPYLNPLHQAVSVQAQLTELLVLWTVTVNRGDAGPVDGLAGATDKPFNTLKSVIANLAAAMIFFTVAFPVLYVLVRSRMRVRIERSFDSSAMILSPTPPSPDAGWLARNTRVERLWYRKNSPTRLVAPASCRSPEPQALRTDDLHLTPHDHDD